jgi:RNA polymerase sigma-70 factor (ECF subfamily)
MNVALLNPHGRAAWTAFRASRPKRSRLEPSMSGSPDIAKVTDSGKTADPKSLSACIVAIAERSDRDAFETLFKHFAPRVKSYLIRLGAPAEAAEELAQETLLTVWRRAGAYNPALAAASTWIFTIARNLRIDLARRALRQTLPDDPAETTCQEPMPDEALNAVQDEARIKRALAILPADQIRVITLAFFADKPHSEIALDLGLPLGTVKSRLRLAMARLRAALDDLAPDARAQEDRS